MTHHDSPRCIRKKEIAAALGVHPATLSHWQADGLTLPLWPCTLADCVGTVRRFFEAREQAAKPRQ